MLIDTGWSSECAVHPTKHLGFGLWFAGEPVMKEDEAVPAQLQKLAGRASDLDAILLTHFDCDHVSGLVSLKEAKHIYCSRPEWEHAQKKDVRYNPKFWKGVRVETLEMNDDPDAPFGKSCDVFGDRSFQDLSTARGI